MKALFLVLFCSTAWAISEKDYQQVWESEVRPFYQHMQDGTFTNAQNLKINYRFQKHDNALRTLVILPGLSEAMIKYAELMYDLRSPEVNIFIMSHQGQGESERLLQTDAAHVRRFQHYVNDVRQFMREVVIPATEGTERVLLAHSLGGAVATHYLKAVPTAFVKAVLSAPMLKMNTAPYSENVALWYTKLLILAGKGTHYAPERGPYKPENDTFAANYVTSSVARFESNKRLWSEDPSLIVGGPTTRWVKESIVASKKTTKLASKITTDVLILQAGKDVVVENSRQNTFCAKAPKCQIVLFPGSKHEVLQERDDIREKALERLKSFLFAK